MQAGGSGRGAELPAGCLRGREMPGEPCLGSQWAAGAREAAGPGVKALYCSVCFVGGLWLEEDPPRWRQGCPGGNVTWVRGRLLCCVPWWKPWQRLSVSVSLCLEEQSLNQVPSLAPQDHFPSQAGGC